MKEILLYFWSFWEFFIVFLCWGTNWAFYTIYCRLLRGLFLRIWRAEFTILMDYAIQKWFMQLCSPEIARHIRFTIDLACSKCSISARFFHCPMMIALTLQKISLRLVARLAAKHPKYRFIIRDDHRPMVFLGKDELCSDFFTLDEFYPLFWTELFW